MGLGEDLVTGDREEKVDTKVDRMVGETSKIEGESMITTTIMGAIEHSVITTTTITTETIHSLIDTTDLTETMIVLITMMKIDSKRITDTMIMTMARICEEDKIDSLIIIMVEIMIRTIIMKNKDRERTHQRASQCNNKRDQYKNHTLTLANHHMD